MLSNIDGFFGIREEIGTQLPNTTSLAATVVCVEEPIARFAKAPILI